MSARRQARAPFARVGSACPTCSDRPAEGAWVVYVPTVLFSALHDARLSLGTERLAADVAKAGAARTTVERAVERHERWLQESPRYEQFILRATAWAVRRTLPRSHSFELPMRVGCGRSVAVVRAGGTVEIERIEG